MAAEMKSSFTTFNHCGSVYCSQALEDFQINCRACSQDFNLISYNLFIQHIRECLPTRTPDAIENIFNPAVNVEILDNANSQLDPLLSLKVEIEPAVFADEQTNEEVDYYLDCKEEDDLTIDKIALRSTVNEVLNEYKKHPILWDANLSKSATHEDRTLHYKEITNAINLKCKMNFTAPEIGEQILRLRNGYMQARKMEEMSPKPWYFNKMYFIMETHNYIENKTNQTSNDADKYSDKKNVTFAEVSFNEKKKESKRYQLNDVNIIEDIIDQYKESANLWDLSNPLYKDNISRKKTLSQITRFINNKYNTTFNRKDITKKINYLRNAHRRVTNQFQKFNRPINLWYYQKLSFVSTNFEHVDDVDCVIPIDHVENCDSADDGSEPKDCKKIIMSIIEEYKKYPCLWDSDIINESTSYDRLQANRAIKDAINTKFKTSFSETTIKRKIAQLSDCYRHAIASNEAANSPLYYFDQISFVGLADCLQQKYDDNQMSIDSDEDIREPKSSALIQKGIKIKTNKMILALIELYKAAPILWDTNHRDFRLRKERGKVYESISSTLSLEYSCHITHLEVRNRIRNLRLSYFAFLRNQTGDDEGALHNPKSFFYDQMSFLEPFVNKEPAPSPNLQIKKNIGPSQDFTFLLENRPLMTNVIELLKEQVPLWNKKIITMEDSSSQSEAYEKLIGLFRENDIILAKEQVASFIRFLQAKVLTAQKALKDDKKSEEPMWFYKDLKFLSKIPRLSNKLCSHCNQLFRNIREYEQHKIEIAGDFPYNCDICNTGFLTNTKYRYHQLKHKQPLKCDQCDFQAYDKHNFKVHMNRHQGVRTYFCSTCDKGFVTSTELKRHLLTHTGEKPFVCEICGKKMAASSDYHQHMKRHRNQRDHKCGLCDYAAYDTEGLRDHMVTHSTERNHICNICGATFKKKSTLRQHKTLHDKEKRHMCKICGKVFAQNAGLYSHMKSHGIVAEKI